MPKSRLLGPVRLPGSLRLSVYLLIVAALLGMHALTVATGQCHGSAVGIHNSQAPMSSDQLGPVSGHPDHTTPSGHTTAPAPATETVHPTGAARATDAAHAIAATAETAAAAALVVVAAQEPGVAALVDPELDHASVMLCAVVLIVGALLLLGIRLVRIALATRDAGLPATTSSAPPRAIPVYLQLLTLRL